MTFGRAAILLGPAVFAAAARAGEPQIGGDLLQWHKVTLTLEGPHARETDSDPNPFTDYRLTVRFEHESGSPVYDVPGYFAADGDAANTSAREGNRWRAHLSPDRPGLWKYTVSFVRGKHAALGGTGEPSRPLDGSTGTFAIAPTDKEGRDFRGKGRLRYVGKHHLRFAGTGEYFLKAGPDSPETLLAFADFDDTVSAVPPEAPRRKGEAARAGLHRYEPHVKDWRPGDPTWKDGRGKGLIGALDYIAAKGLNSISFLPYNAGGDGDNVWPFAAREDKLHYDCSKLDQWGIVFDHATRLGLHLHFKLQETEMDDGRDAKRNPISVPEALDGGKLGPERKLYLRELIARFGHALALVWNLGEENTQSTEEVRDMARFLREIDPYDHPIAIHTYPGDAEQEAVYRPLLGDGSALTGASLQNSWRDSHRRTLHWVTESAKAGKPWVIANDETGPAGLGVPPDPGYRGFGGTAREKPDDAGYDLHDIRKRVLWGTILAGGAGVEYYFGYTLPENDLGCEDFRSRERSWDYCRIALEFFRENSIPFWDMRSHDALLAGSANRDAGYCLAKPGEIYLVYLPDGGSAELDLAGIGGTFRVDWFDPRSGGALRKGGVERVNGGGKASLGTPPADPREDWLIVLRPEAAGRP